MKQTILAIVGASGSGKTVLSWHLRDKYNIPTVVSYTTRPMRSGEIDGRDHFFVEDPGVDVRTIKKCLAWTNYGGYQYWIEISQIQNGHSNIYSYVIDETGLSELRKNYTDKFNIVALKVERPNNPTEASRTDRDKTRTDVYTDWDLVVVNDSDEATFFAKAGRAISTFLSHIGKSIVVDFDGTCVKHRCPLIGDDIGAAPVLRKLAERGHRIVLSTMRDSDMNMEDVKNWFTKNSIPLHGVGVNPDQVMWTKSPKPYGNYYIDDASLGTPVKYDEHGRKYVDWERMLDILKSEGLIEARWKPIL